MSPTPTSVTTPLLRLVTTTFGPSSPSPIPSLSHHPRESIFAVLLLRDVPGRKHTADASTEPVTSLIMSASAHTDAGHGGDPVSHVPGHSQHNYAHDALDLEDGLWQEAVFARLPDDAPPELRELVSDIENPRRVWAVYRASRRHDFQLVVDR